MIKKKIIGCIVFAFCFFQCVSTQFERNPPFSVKSATFNKGISKITTYINYKTTTKIIFHNIFFRGRKIKVELQTVKNKTFISGHFSLLIVNPKEDLILDGDRKREYGNEAPKKKFPFELKENEAVISYTGNGQIKYCKIKNIILK